jgi:hypothetical protein
MVVSGSHLVFLEILTVFLPVRIRLTILAAYCYFTGFQAPVVRAFLRRTLSRPLTDLSGLTSLQIEAAAVIVALALYPPWLGSRSFLMSWMCGIAMCSPPIFKKFRHLDMALRAYLFLLPFCWASPVSVAWNTLLAPFVGLILFPLSLGAMILPVVTPLSDLMWRGFLGILDLGPHGAQLSFYVSSWGLCWLPPLVHGFLLYMEVRWRRESAFSYSYSF